MEKERIARVMPSFAVWFSNRSHEKELSSFLGDTEPFNAFKQYFIKYWTTGAAVMFILTVNTYVQCIIFRSRVKSTQAFCVINLKNVFFNNARQTVKKEYNDVFKSRLHI